MPSNTFGENDNYDVMNSHFLPALIKKIFFAKKNKKLSLRYGDLGIPKEKLYM